MQTNLSYAQRYEDLHLLRCFGAQASGFYVDIGAGIPSTAQPRVSRARCASQC